jgi:hypothetical protein
LGGDSNNLVACKAFYCGTTAGNYHGFYICGYDNTFTACEAQDNYQSGFYGDYSGDPTYGTVNTTLINCLADDNGQAANATYSKGYQLVGVQYWTIVGGKAINRPYGSNWQNYGVSIEGASSNVQVTDVLFFGNNTSPVNQGSSSQPIRIRNCSGYNPHTVSAPAFPASTGSYTNTSGVDIYAYITNGVGTMTTSVGGVTGPSFIASANGVVFIPAGAAFIPTYASGSPSWHFQGN